jgi:glycosyltransferase involved in cell wall biosynthesis
MPEVGGDAVLYFDPEDPADIAARLGDILEGRWRPDSRKYAERLAGFDWDVSAARYREVIEELAGAARGAG